MAATKRSLSRNLTAMKFMQRSKPNDPEGEEPQGASAFSCHPVEQWIVPDAKTFTAQTGCNLDNSAVDSIAKCLGLDSLGRKSYNGFNLEIEKLMKEESLVATTTEADDEEVLEGTIPALEMAARYQQLMNKYTALPVKRVPSKSKMEPKPKKFLKPSLD